MRRIWIGVGLLAVLLVLGLTVMSITDRRLGQVSETLQQASEARDWEKAVSLAQSAHREWESSWQLMAALADHTDMDNIDGIFARLEVYRHRRSETDHAAACAQLSEAIRDLEENHRFTWWNLL